MNFSLPHALEILERIPETFGAIGNLDHLTQTSRVMATQYREAVGPWRAFLPILDR